MQFASFTKETVRKQCYIVPCLNKKSSKKNRFWRKFMKILGKNEVASGKWLALEILDYVDRNGKERKWECVSRKRCAGAVLMIAELLPSHRLVLIRQYRPPADGVVLEFPAGLIDEGESPEDAALRELREETGYHGVIRKVYPPAYNSPGLTGEFIHTVLMEVAEDAQGELKTDFDESEQIETLLIPKHSLLKSVEAMSAEGIRIDAKVLAYAIAEAAR